MIKKPMICVPIMERQSRSVVLAAEKAIGLGADILEFRVDALQNPDLYEIKDIIEEIDYSMILTNRLQDEGGFFKGSERERVEILIKTAEYVDMVDIELQTNIKLVNQVIEASKSTILSFHDFKKTPSFQEIIAIVKREHELGDIAKFAVMPKNYKDTLVVLNVLSELDNTIGISMGEIGKYTRLIAPIFGSPITYASIDKESAPGQLDVQTTKEILKKLAVID